MIQDRSRKLVMPDRNHFQSANGDGDEDDDDEKHWYRFHTSAPPLPQNINNHTNFAHQLSPATIGSWGFDVNRSTNEQTPLSFTSNNTHNNDQHKIARTTKDDNEHLVHMSPSLLSAQSRQLRAPALTRRRDGNEFVAVDRLVRGPTRTTQTHHYQFDDSMPQQPISTPQLRSNPYNHRRIQTQQELMAWQRRMLEKDQQFGGYQLSKSSIKRSGCNSFQIPNRPPISSSVRPISSMSTASDSQYLEHDHPESTIKTARVIKRYIELLYHVQTYYERVTDQLFNGNSFLRTNHSCQSIFINHCRRISDQLQQLKPKWEEKLVYLQNLLRDTSSFLCSPIQNETSFLQRRTTLINLLQTFNSQKDLDGTDLSIRSDIDRVLYDDKLAIQLQDELSTLLQHKSLLNDLISLLQWNRPIYSLNEQNRVDSVLPLLSEQISITDSYISHVSQQLTELVMNLRSLEKYILSYTNSIPSIDDGTVPIQSVPHAHNEENDRIAAANSNEMSRLRSASMTRVPEIQQLHFQFDRDDQRLVATKNGNIQINMNNSNNNDVKARLATVKSAKRDSNAQPNSILKPYPPVLASYERKRDLDNYKEMFKSNKIEIRDLSIGFDTDDQLLIRNMAPRQNIRNINDQYDYNDEDISSEYFPRKVESEHDRLRFIEEMAEKNRPIAAKHAVYRSYQQRMVSTDDAK